MAPSMCLIVERDESGCVSFHETIVTAGATTPTLTLRHYVRVGDCYTVLDPMHRYPDGFTSLESQSTR